MITDQLFEQFQSELRSRGYEIIPAEELQLDADFAKRLSSTENIKTAKQDSSPRMVRLLSTLEVQLTHSGIMQGATEMHLAERFGKGSAMLKVRPDQFRITEDGLSGARRGGCRRGHFAHKAGLTLDTTPDSASPSQISMATSSGLWPRPLMLPIS